MMRPAATLPLWHGAVAASFGLLSVMLGWVLDGQALLGRVDPALAIPTLLIPALGAMRFVCNAAAQSRLAFAALCTACLIVAQAGLAGALAGAVVAAQLGIATVAAAFALLLADRLWRWRWMGARGIRVMAVVFWFIGSHMLLSQLYAADWNGARKPSLVVMSGLPLRWNGAGNLAAVVARGTASAPALTRLEQDFSVALVDSLLDHGLSQTDVLLLAHPRALPPVELVAIDDFVRRGGRAIILADALSSWPIDAPLGDPRNPPVTSLLTPLLGHWGVTLGGARMTDQTPVAVEVEGRRLVLVSAGTFDQLPAGCRTFAARRIANCAIGAGQVWLVGDADLLFAPLWQSPIAGAAHLRRADTMVWLESLIGGAGAAPHAALQPQWIRPF